MNFQSLLQSVRSVKTIEHYGYVLGYVTAETMHGFITKSEYDILFNLLQQKRERL